MDPPPTQPPAMPPHPSTMAPTTVMAATATSIQTNNPDSVESSPRCRIGETWNDELIVPVPGAKLRLMCSYGGHIMPRPHDKSLSYIGGDTRIVVVDRNSTLKDLCLRLSRTLLNGRPFTLKYQLPNEDLDNLISVTTDEDLDNMIEEYDRVAAASASTLKPSPSRLRVFLFFSKPETTVSMGSLLDDAKSETWFVDALNNSGMLTRGVSDSAAGETIVNLDGVGPAVSASGSSNNLEAQAAAVAESLVLADNITGNNNNNNNNKVKNLQDVAAVNSLPGSPSSASSPSMANLPPIRVRVDDNGASRLQQEQRVGVMEEQLAQMTIGASGVRRDEGFVVVPSTVAMPAAVPATMSLAAAAMVTSNSSDIMNRLIISEDERSDPGVPLGFGKPPLPLQLVQPRTGGGVSLPSPDSVASDSSSIASTNSFSKNVYYQEQVQPSHVDNKAPTISNAKIEIREQIQDPNYTLPPQLDQNQQLHQQFVQASSPYIHHPAAATNTVPVSSYYPVYAPPPPLPSQPTLHQHPIPQTQQQQQYQPVYVMPVGHTQQPYNVTLQHNIADPNMVASGRQLVPQSIAAPAVSTTAYKDGTLPIYPPRPNTQPQTTQAFIQIPSSHFQQQPQYVGLTQVQHHQQPPPPQHIAVVPSGSGGGGGANYGYEYGGGTVQDQAAYYTQQQQATTAPLTSQYQSMTPAAAAAALSDASKPFPNENLQQPNRASQPV
ncbi:hypothetical protein HN51_070781 [Arachis hypogaea]|uniref:PB1 domain-containing protein n=1 Tax=Arachis hypogaea TaxID=3818 RepID=A0A444Z0P5_ARAHY|nr:uncharacterized protein LOC112751063 [Arachis hypogaea]QHO13373.1 uncharacterized protein DS421_15g514970 [Arachis hypogaea]RYR07762.1 hypothetical protein Ahy_B05g075192 [Arachis hypogaea]